MEGVQTQEDKFPLSHGEVVVGKDTYKFKTSLSINVETRSVPKASYQYEIFTKDSDVPVARISLYLVSKEYAIEILENLVAPDNYDYVLDGFIFVGSGMDLGAWIPSYLFNKRMDLVPQFITQLTERSIIELGKCVMSHVLATSENQLKKRSQGRMIGKWTNLMMKRYNRSHKDANYTGKQGRNYTHYFRGFTT